MVFLSYSPCGGIAMFKAIPTGSCHDTMQCGYDGSQ